MSINTFPSAIVSFTIVLLIAGLVTGLIISDSELANPFSSFTQARRLGEQGELDREYYERAKRAELEALAQKYQRDLAFVEERHQVEMAQMERRQQIVDSLLVIVAASISLAILVAGAGLAYYLVCIGRGRMVDLQVQAASRVNWKDKLQRAEAVHQAREAERQWRAEMQPAVNGNGHGHEQIRPAWDETELAPASYTLFLPDYATKTQTQ